jgi:hypothetical protein
MNKVLMYGNRKCDPTFWDVSSRSLEDKAFLELFEMLDEHWEVYSDLGEIEQPQLPSLTQEQIDALPEGRVKQTALEEQKEYPERLREYKQAVRQKELYDKAKQGDTESLKSLMRRRKSHEYEQWEICDVK